MSSSYKCNNCLAEEYLIWRFVFKAFSWVIVSPVDDNLNIFICDAFEMLFSGEILPNAEGLKRSGNPSLCFGLSGYS